MIIINNYHHYYDNGDREKQTFSLTKVHEITLAEVVFSAVNTQDLNILH